MLESAQLAPLRQGLDRHSLMSELHLPAHALQVFVQKSEIFLPDLPYCDRSVLQPSEFLGVQAVKRGQLAGN